MANLFCCDMASGNVTNLGVAASVLEQRRYGYQFGDAVTGRDGEIVFGEDDNGAGAWLAGACTAAAALDCWLVGEAETLWPSSDTTYRPPAVAAAAPSTHAPAPMTMRVCMRSESRMLR